jgi:hypothetical protein
MIKYPDIDRIDFEDYLRSNPDFAKAFGSDQVRARKHWHSNGRFEGRNFRLKDVDYERVEKFVLDDIRCGSYSGPDFNMITSLYNEEDPQRLQEYALTLKLNIRHQLINRIYVFYDMSNGWNSELGSLFDNHKVSLIEYYGRPSFRELFEFSNIVGYEGCNWIVCNGDIVPSWDFCRLAIHERLAGKMMSVTRWNLMSEDKLSIFSLGGKIPNILSQDTWVYQTPLKYPEELKDVRMGEMLCDSNLNYFFKVYNLPIFNPCLDLRTFHIHFQNCRSYSPGDQSKKLFPHSWAGHEDFELIRHDPHAPSVEVCRLEDI